MKKILTILFLIQLSWLKAYSCECGWKSVRETFKSSDLVIKGKVLSIDTAYVFETEVFEKLKKDSTAETFSTLWLRSIRLEVKKVYKGQKVAQEIRILTPIESAGTCFFHFDIGETYILYTSPQAGFLEDTKAEDEVLNRTGSMPKVPIVFKEELQYTDACMRAQRFSKTEEQQLVFLKLR